MSVQVSAIVVCATIILCSPEAGQRATADQAAVVASAQKIAVAAVTFREGDAAGFNRARPNFTSEGWQDFVRRMAGYIDKNGAPTFTSDFVPARDAVFLGEKDGVLLLRIPGTLTQSNKLGRTTYRAALEVDVILDSSSSDTPIKVRRLEQITCAGQSTKCQ